MGAAISKTTYISDTIHGSIPISQLEKRIISTRIFNRLHNISQNSTAYLTFPTNRTRRFEHSIGTMHLAGQVLFYSISNSKGDTVKRFFTDFENEIKKITQQVHGHDATAAFFREKLGDANLKDKFLNRYSEVICDDCLYKANTPAIIFNLTKVGLFAILYQSIRLVGLLHDLGHPPMSHITENSLLGIWEEVSGSSGKPRETEFKKCTEQYFNDDHLALHESIGLSLAKTLLEYSTYSCPESMQECDNCRLKAYFELLVHYTVLGILGDKENTFFQSLHAIISGSFDCDRLDYISRDLINSGLNSGIIEYGRLIPTMSLIYYKDCYWFCPHMKMIDLVEDYFYRRWMLYKKVIYHHRVIKTDYLLERCIKHIALQYIRGEIEKEEDTIEEVLPYNISGLWKAVKYTPSREVKNDTILQWTDDWLLTVIKKHFYVHFKSNKDNPMFYMLEEIISNIKSYYSLVKKDAEFAVMDSAIKSVIRKKKAHLLNLIPEDIRSTKLALAITTFIEATESPVGYCLSRFRFEICPLCSDEIGAAKHEKDFRMIIQSALKKTLGSGHYATEIDDYFFALKRVKTGLEADFLMHNEYSKTPFYFSNVSCTGVLLNLQRNALIPVNIYLKKGDTTKDVEFKSIVKVLGRAIGENICSFLQRTIGGGVSGFE